MSVDKICNICNQFKTKDFELYFTSCGHLVCEKCKTEITCALCNEKMTYVKLDDSMPTSAKIFFEDPVENFKKHLKVVQFQLLQKNILLTMHKREIKNLKDHSMSLRKENQNLKARNSQLEMELEKKSNQLISLTYTYERNAMDKIKNPDKNSEKQKIKTDYSSDETKKEFFFETNESQLFRDNTKQNFNLKENKDEFFVDRLTNQPNKSSFLDNITIEDSTQTPMSIPKNKPKQHRKSKITFDTLDYYLQ